MCTLRRYLVNLIFFKEIELLSEHDFLSLSAETFLNRIYRNNTITERRRDLLSGSPGSTFWLMNCKVFLELLSE